MSYALLLVGMTLLPFLELRASIPYGILNTPLHWKTVFVICVATNTILGPLIFVVIDKAIHLFFFVKWFERFWHRKVEKVQKKIHRDVEKYGELALAIFIGIPLPGSGSYTGAIAATVIGMSFRKFLVANLIGVLIAGTLVTAAVLTGAGILRWMI